jgi:hypothetical protein
MELGEFLGARYVIGLDEDVVDDMLSHLEGYKPSRRAKEAWSRRP